MAVRDDFTAGEVLAAADLNDTFASKPPFAYGTATPSTTVEGFIWYDENDTPPAPKFWDGSAFETFGGGKILQIVRATDGTLRTTTSTSFVDGSLSVTISPKKSTSAVLLVHTAAVGTDATRIFLQITDSSNNGISGSDAAQNGNAANTWRGHVTNIGYATPGTTSATTFKVRFRSETAAQTVYLQNQLLVAQLYAIEVAA
jgi:hypothetical protein